MEQKDSNYFALKISKRFQYDRFQIRRNRNQDSYGIYSYGFNEVFSLNKENPKIMNEKFYKNISYQIISGINFLHSERIIHRDIKLENILYYEKRNLTKIRDFGHSRTFDYCLENKYTDVGTYPYKQPEILLGLRKYTMAFDIWWIGCRLVQICSISLLFGAEV